VELTYTSHPREVRHRSRSRWFLGSLYVAMAVEGRCSFRAVSLVRYAGSGSSDCQRYPRPSTRTGRKGKVQSEQSGSICKQKAHDCSGIENNGSTKEEHQLVLSVFYDRQSLGCTQPTHVPEDEHEAPFLIIHVPASSLSMCTLDAD